MEGEENKTQSSPKPSRKALLKLLNNIGFIGAIMAAVADIIFVIIMVLGINIHVEMSAIILFSIVNALVGILINVLLRYQGKKYAEIENDDLCKEYYDKRIKEYKYVSMEKWMAIKTIEDFLIKGATAAFSIFGIIYITIQGSHNPIQILITLANLILFVCFGMMSMNSSYTRFYNIQVPYMQMKLKERQNVSNIEDIGNNTGSVPNSSRSTDTIELEVKEVEVTNLPCVPNNNN